MSVTRCRVCHRGKAGYQSGEKSIRDLTQREISTEIQKGEEKVARIRSYIERRKTGLEIQQTFPEGRPCPECGQAWREFQHHQRDLEQLTIRQAVAAIANQSRWLIALRRSHVNQA